MSASLRQVQHGAAGKVLTTPLYPLSTAHNQTNEALFGAGTYAVHPKGLPETMLVLQISAQAISLNQRGVPGWATKRRTGRSRGDSVGIIRAPQLVSYP
jgi:hypothetical protein